MKIIVNGATGATGKLLVNELIDREQTVLAVVRSPHKLPPEIKNSDKFTMIKGNLLELSEAKTAEYIQDCDAVVSCLGHPMNLKGIWGAPRRLVTDAARKFCEAIIANNPDSLTKFILMNTAGFHEPDIDDPISFAQRSVINILRFGLPPHPDNEQAALYLKNEIGPANKHIHWSVVRPDTLTDENKVTNYLVHPKPIRSAIFDPGKTSRINVAHFIADLITDETVWKKWEGKLPVIYNEESAA